MIVWEEHSFISFSLVLIALPSYAYDKLRVEHPRTAAKTFHSASMIVQGSEEIAQWAIN